MKTVGKPLARIDGPLKTTGSAVYTSDHTPPGTLYGVPVGATIANGKLTSLDTSKAEKMAGVRAVYHRANFGPIFRTAADPGFTAYVDEKRPPFEDDIIRYHGQYIALIVADTFEQAMAAADAVKATYREEKPDFSEDLGVDKTKDGRKVDSERGDVDANFPNSSVKIDQVYTTPTETHSAIELHSSVAQWDGDAVTLYETTQGVTNHRNVLSEQLGVPEEKVRVISRFLGSGFGGKLFPWMQSALAAAAARKLGKPVKIVLSRRQVFQSAGHRPKTQQHVRLGASGDGKLTVFSHEYVNRTAIQEEYRENCGEATPFLYSVPNLRAAGSLARQNVGTPTSMRGPGAVPGLFATETAMDELAIALNIDPVKLRTMNEPQRDEGLNIPFSSRHLLECYQVGMERFGWKDRNPKVGSMTKDGLALGWGMAACSWIAERFDANAAVDLRADGSVRVACGIQDIGVGAYTMLAQVTGERLGVPAERVEVVLGDTRLPKGPLNGGSMATASVIPAVFAAADNATKRLVQTAATSPNSPFMGKKPDELEYAEGKVRPKGGTGGTTFADLLKAVNVQAISGAGESKGTFGPKPDVSRHSYGAQFVEVGWEAATARLRVNRVVTVIDAGRIINPKMARNQIAGSVVMGIGMALFEETSFGLGQYSIARYGRWSSETPA